MARTQDNDTVAVLRAQILRIERRSGVLAHDAARLACGATKIDTHLCGGLERGTTHEVIGRGADTPLGYYPTRWIAAILSRTTGPVAWIHTGRLNLLGEGLSQAGLSPDRLICLHAAPDRVLGLTEDVLRETGLAAVVTDFDQPLGLTASRRLRLAAEGSGQTAFLLRRARKMDDPALVHPTASSTRWRVGPAPFPAGTAPVAFRPGRPRMHVELLRHRGGRAGEWIVETEHAPDHLAVVSPLADRPAAPAWIAQPADFPTAGHARP
ncbi:ImuA family protein [Komagataeibacter sp. SM21]|uniref:ImuA family protein n=1 Tax=Komagataeibacter sp. SM21 TaxID=3242899 RepID=UPI0035274A49